MCQSDPNLPKEINSAKCMAVISVVVDSIFLVICCFLWLVGMPLGWEFTLSMLGSVLCLTCGSTVACCNQGKQAFTNLYIAAIFGTLMQTISQILGVTWIFETLLPGCEAWANVAATTPEMEDDVEVMMRCATIRKIMVVFLFIGIAVILVRSLTCKYVKVALNIITAGMGGGMGGIVAAQPISPYAQVQGEPIMAELQTSTLVNHDSANPPPHAIVH